MNLDGTIIRKSLINRTFNSDFLAKEKRKNKMTKFLNWINKCQTFGNNIYF